MSECTCQSKCITINNTEFVRIDEFERVVNDHKEAVEAYTELFRLFKELSKRITD